MSAIIGTASVTLLREYADGSADYQFNFPPEALDALTRLGILTAIQAGIGEAEDLNPVDEPKIEAWEEGWKAGVDNAKQLLLTQHEAANGRHNYWLAAAKLIEAEEWWENDNQDNK
jgi:hypothetical protein